MYVDKKIRRYPAILVVAVALLLLPSLQGSAFAQQGKGAASQGAKVVSGFTMKAVSGKVVQTMNSGGYTYALVEKDGEQTWVALPTSQIAVGDEISCRTGGEMNNFTSKTLGRTFDHIVFSGGLISSPGAEASASAAAPVKAPEINKYPNAKAFTIGEIFDKKASLAFTPVAVKGKVVKINKGIMGKNWLHLQDGTGSKAAGTNDLTVTTDSDPAKVGDTVTATGKLSLDRDFGSGYHYDVIMEGAYVVK